MKTHQRIYILAAVILGVLLCASCGKKLTGIKIKPSGYDFIEGAIFTIGESIKFSAEFIPENAKDCSVTWYSSNPAVAIVDNAGLMTTVGYGRATIICKTDNKKEFTDSIRISVTENYAAKLVGEYRGTLIVNDTTITDIIVGMVKTSEPSNIIHFDIPKIDGQYIHGGLADIIFENGVYNLYGEYAYSPASRTEGVVDTQGNANLKFDIETDPPMHITFTGKRE